MPGGGGNKIEQQVREANAFYDNVGRWGTSNGFVVVIVQRHPGQNWDDGGRDIAAAVDWVKANISKFRGNGGNIVIGAHSAGTLPLGVYVGHPERWPNGVNVKAAFFMSGAPIPSLALQEFGGGGTAPITALFPSSGPQPGATCGVPMPASLFGNAGAIAGPSGVSAGRRGGAGPSPDLGGGGQQPTPQEQAGRDSLPGFKKTAVKIMLVRAELDTGVMGDMLPSDHAIHDQLCAIDGPNAKDGDGHCPMMLFAKRHSHMSEVFAFDTKDTTVSKPILDWIRKVK